MNSNELLFHASSVGKLMIDGQGSKITEKQLEQITELELKRDNPKPLLTEKQLENLASLRKEKKEKGEAGETFAASKQTRIDTYEGKEGKFKELTDTEKETLEKLIAKRDKPFELSKTAKTYIRSLKNRHEYNFVKPVIVDSILKGHLNEEDSISMCQRHIPSKDFRIKNTQHFQNDFLIGTPDVILKADQIVEDDKTSETLESFQNAEFPELYFAQLQSYMDLLGFKKARLIYCLTSTPASMVASIKKSFYYKLKFNDELDSEEDHDIKMKLYEEACEKIEAMHNVDHIPEENRIKVFEVEYDEAYMKELKFRILLARKYYDKIKMPHVNDVIKIN